MRSGYSYDTASNIASRSGPRCNWGMTSSTNLTSLPLLQDVTIMLCGGQHHSLLQWFLGRRLTCSKRQTIELTLHFEERGIEKRTVSSSNQIIAGAAKQQQIQEQSTARTVSSSSQRMPQSFSQMTHSDSSRDLSKKLIKRPLVAVF